MEDKEDNVTKEAAERETKELEHAIAVEGEVVTCETTGNPMPKGMDKRAKFAKSNRLSGGNPYFKYLQAFQHCILTSVKQAQLKAVMQAMIKKAIEGDVNAARLVFERTCGRIPPEMSIQMTNLSQGNLTICIQTDNENSLENGPILEEPPPSV